ncbi:MAG: D-alanine--D-alanine ligase [Halioglobus sp.]|nr:D-alanine--D-alanine ligase [Halioglobus sp.]
MSFSALQGRPVAVLLGGVSSERDISLQSGLTVLEALQSQGVDALAVDPAEGDWLQQLDGVGLAFIALHGLGGEDGGLQGALQALEIPYTGSGVLGSALAMDKKRSKQLWQGIGLSTPRFITLDADADWQSVIDCLGSVFVKPAREGSSIGMSQANNVVELQSAFTRANRYAGEVVAEQFVDGPEYTVAVLGEAALPSIRLEPANTFYDYESKYVSSATRYHCPSGLDLEQEAELAAMALSAFQSLGCSVWGRVDVMRDSMGQFQVLEVNTVPGMTSHSLVPMAAAASGMDVAALVRRIVALSLEEDR